MYNIFSSECMKEMQQTTSWTLWASLLHNNYSKLVFKKCLVWLRKLFISLKQLNNDKNVVLVIRKVHTTFLKHLLSGFIIRYLYIFLMCYFYSLFLFHTYFILYIFQIKKSSTSRIKKHFFSSGTSFYKK